MSEEKTTNGDGATAVMDPPPNLPTPGTPENEGAPASAEPKGDQATGETPVTPVVEVKADPQADFERKRLKAMERAGKRIAKHQAELAKQETVVATHESNLKAAREVRNAAARTLQQEYEELAKLSVGQYPERLFTDTDEATPDADNATAPAKANDAWRSAPTAEWCLKPKLQEKLIVGLEKSGVTVTNLGQLSDWKNANEFRKWTHVDGIGKAKAEEIDDAWLKVWEKYPQGESPHDADAVRRELVDAMYDRLVTLGMSDADARGDAGDRVSDAIMARIAAVHVDDVAATVKAASVETLGGWAVKFAELPAADVISIAKDAGYEFPAAPTEWTDEKIVANTVDDCDKLDDMLAKFDTTDMRPDAFSRWTEFSSGVAEQVNGIRNTVKSSNRVTVGQRDAIDNIFEAVSKWQH